MCTLNMGASIFYPQKKAEGRLFIVFISDVSENHIALNTRGVKTGEPSETGDTDVSWC